MTTKQTVNKAQSVRDYLDAHPGAGSREIVAALDKQGIKIASGHVATVKAVMYETEARKGVEKPVTDTLTIEQIKMVAQAIRRIRSRLHPSPNT